VTEMTECSWCVEWIQEEVEPVESELVLGRYCSKQCARDAEEEAERRHAAQQMEKSWWQAYDYED
jgi:hypothetical protein